MFDARCFNIPKEEVTNLVYWRQLDASRNSIQMVGQANFSHKELQNKSCNDIQNMLMTQKGINWNDLPTYQKRGSCCVRNKIVIESDAVTTTDGLEAAENFLQAYPELNGVVGINDSVVLGAYEAFKAADRIGDDVGLFACDGSLEGLEAVAEGSIHRGTVSLHLNDVGKQMIDDGITLVNGGTLESTTNYFPLEAVTKDNVQDFIDELN